MTKLIFALALAAVVMPLTACAPQADLNGTSWNLASLNGGPVQDGTQPTLAFADGQVSGNASCNGFGGEYTQRGDKLTFGALMSTLMACFPEEIMQQEQAYFSALTATASFRVDDGILSLFDADGNVLAEFAVVP